MAWLEEEEREILLAIRQVQRDVLNIKPGDGAAILALLKDLEVRVTNVQDNLVRNVEPQLDAQLQQLNVMQATLDAMKVTLDGLAPPPDKTAVGLAEISLTAIPDSPPQGEQKMAGKLKAAVDVAITDNGNGAEYVFGAVDSVGESVPPPAGTPPPTYTSSDPNWTVTPDPADATGFSAIGKPSLQPGAKLPITGITVTASVTFPGATAPATVTSDGIDLNPGPAAGIAEVSLTAL